MRYILATIILVLATLTISGCAHSSLTSHRAGAEMTVDGAHQEWSNRLTFIEQDRVGLGIANDDRHIYFCMVVSDPVIARQIMVRGLTLWFDPRGKKVERIGIKYPIGMLAMDPSLRRELMQSRRGQQRRLPGQREDDGVLARMLMDFELIDNTGQGARNSDRSDYAPTFRMPVHNNEEDIDLKLRHEGSGLVYEAKIPFSALGVNAVSPGSGVIRWGIGVETGELNLEALRDQRGGMRRPGEGARPGGFGGNPMGGGTYSQRRDLMDGLSYWGKVTLAHNES